MRTTNTLGNLIRAYANDEEATRFTSSQVNAILNNSAKKILRYIPSGASSLSTLREYVWWQFADMDNISANNPPSHEFDFNDKITTAGLELLSTNHFLHTFIVRKQSISTANVTEEDIVHRNVPHSNYWNTTLSDTNKAPAETSANITDNNFTNFVAGDGVSEWLKETIECTIMEVDDMDMRSQWDAKPTIARPISVIYNDKIYVYPRYIASTDDEHWMFAVEFIRCPSDVDITQASAVEWNIDVDNAIIYDVVSELYDIDGDTTRSEIFKVKMSSELAIIGGLAE
tara:strand:+ start:2164 stop:3021 length:858 start_codon:yes stop_codon:yes gene_type:complete